VQLGDAFGAAARVGESASAFEFGEARGCVQELSLAMLLPLTVPDGANRLGVRGSAAMLNSGREPVNRSPSTKRASVRYASRFPYLEHLAWSHNPAHVHHLAMSAVPTPPREIFDPAAGPVLLDAIGEGEREMTRLLAERYGVPSERILLVSGLSEGLYLAACALIEPGDFALVETPGYQSLAGVAIAAGATIRTLPRGLDGALDPAEATACIARTVEEARGAGRRLALVMLADLNNPTSARLTDATVDALAEASRYAGATLLLDEVYRDADPGRPVGTAQSRHPDIVTLSSLTKAYGFGGLRMGWLMAPPELRDACWRVKLFLTVDVSGPAVGLGIRILRVADPILEWARPILEENRQTLTAALYDRPSGFVMPEGASVGTTVFPYRPGGPDTLAEVVSWREIHKLAVIPGAWFGAPSGVRIGLGKPPDAFRKALEVWLSALAAPARA